MPINRRRSKDCWVDIYTDTTFGGKRVRIDPTAVAQATDRVRRVANVGSVIVGPGATVILAHTTKTKTSFHVLKPGAVVPDLNRAPPESQKRRRRRLPSGSEKPSS